MECELTPRNTRRGQGRLGVETAPEDAGISFESSSGRGQLPIEGCVYVDFIHRGDWRKRMRAGPSLT